MYNTKGEVEAKSRNDEGCEVRISWNTLLSFPPGLVSFYRDLRHYLLCAVLHCIPLSCLSVTVCLTAHLQSCYCSIRDSTPTSLTKRYQTASTDLPNLTVNNLWHDHYKYSNFLWSFLISGGKFATDWLMHTRDWLPLTTQHDSASWRRNFETTRNDFHSDPN